MKNLIILFSIFDLEDKRKFILTILVSFISSIFQFFGLSIIVPLIAILSDPNLIYTNSILLNIYNFFLFSSYESFRNALLILSIFGVVSSMCLGLFNVYIMSKFSNNFGEKIEQQVFNYYLNCKYIFHVQNTISKLLSNITNLIPRIKNNILSAYILLITQSFMTLIISITILMVDFYFSIFAIVILTFLYLIFFKLIKKKIKKHGELITTYESAKMKYVYESLSNIKFLNFIKDKIFLKKSHSFASNNLALIFVKNHLINIGPRYFMELVLFLGVITAVIFLTFSGSSFSIIITKLSFFAIAAVKILPAINIIYQNIVAIRSNEHAVLEFKNEFEFISKNKFINSEFKNYSERDEIIFKKNIEIQNVYFEYSKSNFAINNINLKVKKNEFVGFCGTTGSGKTTIVDILTGLHKPHTGHLLVDDREINHTNDDIFRNKIGYVPQDIYLGNNTIEEVITIGQDPKNINYVLLEEVTKKADIYEYIKSLPQGFNTKCGDRGIKLSGGQKQRIGIARALYRRPEIIIFDESTSSLDYYTENKIINTILDLKGKITLILITHRTETIKKADKIFVVSQGKIVDEGKYEDLIESSSFFKNIRNG